jgi:hypothetical protein
MTRSLALAQSLALTLMLFGLAVQAIGVTAGVPESHAAEQHHEGHDHAVTPAHPGSVPLAETQAASIGGEVLDALAALFTRLAAAARGAYICDDCNLPSDDGCQCVCWSGNPRPGDCD